MPETGEYEDEVEADLDRLVAPRPPSATAFGSVWDSQIGVPSAPAAGLGPIDGDEAFDEPEIPEYLIAEQRRGRSAAANRGGRGGRGGPRGGRSAYVAALDRERFGGGRSSTIDRYPDVSGRSGRPAGRGEPPRRTERAPGGRSSEPWSEVPPEVEEMLRAQLATSRRADTAAVAGTSEAASTDATEAEAKPRRRTPRRAAEPATGASATEVAGAEAEPKPRRRTTRKAAATD